MDEPKVMYLAVIQFVYDTDKGVDKDEATICEEVNSDMDQYKSVMCRAEIYDSFWITL